VSNAFVYTPTNEGTFCFATVGTDASGHSEATPTGNGDGCTLYDHTAPTNVTLAATVNGANIALTLRLGSGQALGREHIHRGSRTL